MQQHNRDGIFVLGKETGKVDGKSSTLVIFDDNFVLRELIDVCFCVTPTVSINIALYTPLAYGVDGPAILCLPVRLGISKPLMGDTELAILSQILICFGSNLGQAKQVPEVLQLWLRYLDLEARRHKGGIFWDVVVVGHRR